MKRTPRERGAHDNRVKQVAERLRRGGWNVKADVAGYEKPKPIGKYRNIPDVVATKHGHRKIIEVETPDTVDKDRKQQQSFRRHAGQKPNTTFNIEVTN